MKKKIFFFLSLMLLVLPGIQPLQAAKKPQRTKQPAVDPRALETLKQMTNYLSHLNSFKVHAETSRDVILPPNMALESDQAFDLIVERPNHLRGELQSAAGEKQVFYDGKTFTLYTPALKYYASVPAPPTLDQLFQVLITKYGLEMPAADLISSNPYQALTRGVTSGMYVGESLINGVLCHQLAFRTKAIDWQIWIRSGNMPLPMKLVITERLQNGNPKYTGMFSRWDVSPTLDESIFTFMPEPGDKKISIKQMPGPKVRRAPRARTIPKR